MAGWIGDGQTAAAADSPKPAKKDSNPRIRPKDATLTTAVVPAEAKPGETVSFQVTARLKPGYHIYTYSQGPQGEGPKNTTFDLFDTAGLTIAGDWKPSKEAVQKKEPAFPDLDFVSFYEDEVTWSIPLTIPPNAESGEKTLLCQAGYMICNARSCSLAGQWTLPGAVLKVLGGQAAGANAGAAAEAAAPPAPKKKDSNPRIRPKGVTMTTTVEPEQVAPGDEVTYQVTAKLQPGWHIYDLDDNPPDLGPVPTSFDFFDKAGLISDDTWKPSQPPIRHPEPAFNNLVVSYFENEVTWSQTLRVPADAQPGERVLRCQARYQICDPKSCSPPGQWTLPDVSVTIVAATAKAETGNAKNVAASPKAANRPPAAGNPTASTEAAKATATAGVNETPAPTSASAPAATAAIGSPSTAKVEDRSVTATPTPETSASAPTVAARGVQSEIAQKAEQGLLPFLIASAIGGVFTLVMPCVWPMVPITVNFFVKQGSKGKTTGLAITYCLAIIAVFTLVGVFFSFFFSASSLQRLANNPWLNIVVATLFLAFGLSLLGLFEIRLPNFLLNASAQGESRGGLVGVIFMALTLTITSFTCTFPVVGGLLVMAAGGNFLYPIIGLATFATVLALPFFLLALAPGLISRMPRSGDWMNSVKVVGGLIEIGAALKFINTAELSSVTPENAWFDAQVVLTCWVVLAAVCGIYLLGLFRTDHDHDEVKIGPGRLVFGSAFLGLALYMAPALFGNPPESRVWNRMVVGLLPPDVAELGASRLQLAQNGAAASGDSTGEVKAVSSDPEEAVRQEKRKHGVVWGMSLDQAKEQAKAEQKPILIDFTGVNCANCRTMELSVFPLPNVVKVLEKFVTVQLYTDFVPIDSISSDARYELGTKNQDLLLDLSQDVTNPIYVVLSPSGDVVSSLGGLNEPAVFVDFLNQALSKARGEANVAQVSSTSPR
jgi:thiol:disulfide interchange protein DsbD